MAFPRMPSFEDTFTLPTACTFNGMEPLEYAL
jgi:hypothetical protein